MCLSPVSTGPFAVLRGRGLPIRPFEGIVLGEQALAPASSTPRQVLLSSESAPRPESEPAGGARRVFDQAPVVLAECDVSQLLFELERLRQEGVEDLEKHLSGDLEELWRLGHLVKLERVNSAALALYGATSEAELVNAARREILPRTEGVLRAALSALWRGEGSVRGEAVHRTLDGARRDVLVSATLPTAASTTHICTGARSSLSTGK